VTDGGTFWNVQPTACITDTLWSELSRISIALCNKYGTDVSSLSENIIKNTVWNVFAQTADISI